MRVEACDRDPKSENMVSYDGRESDESEAASHMSHMSHSNQKPPVMVTCPTCPYTTDTYTMKFLECQGIGQLNPLQSSYNEIMWFSVSAAVRSMMISNLTVKLN